MMDISKRVDLTRPGNEWLAYLLPHIQFEVHNETHSTRLDGDKAIIALNKTIWDESSDNVLVESIKHEVGHILYGHCAFMCTLQDNQEKLLWNYCSDCGVHFNCADPKLVAEGLKLWLKNPTADVYTYENMGVPVLPPKILFEYLKKQQGDRLHEDYKSCQIEANKGEGLDWQILGYELGFALDQAIADGVVVPRELIRQAGSESGSGRASFTISTVSTKLWIRRLLTMLYTNIPFGRCNSYRKDPHNEVGGGVLRRGYATTYDKIEVVVAIDASGSIQQEDLSKALKAIYDLTTQYKIEGYAVVFDTTVSPKIPLKNLEGIKGEAVKRGGGTKFQPVFDVVKTRDILIMFTDTHLFESTVNHTHLSKPPILVTETIQSNIPQALSGCKVINTNEK